MIDLLTAHFRAMALDAGVDITYTRGEDTVNLRAIPGRTTHETVEGQVLIAHKTRDYLILAADLLLDETAIQPQRGDTITEGTATANVAPPPGSPGHAYEPNDPYGVVLRVHTSR